MRIPLTCMRCFTENGVPDDIYYPAELQDNGLYKLTCSNGHESFVCVQEQKFEVLFELSLNAITDGYYREAVASFASSLERFYEFYLRVICSKCGIQSEEFERAWKDVSNQSERQYGAYAFTYFQENGVAAPRLNDSIIKFRNNVIHKGVIPSKEEAVSFGEAVLEVIHPVLQTLKEREAEAVKAVVWAYIRKVHSKVADVAHVSFMSIGTTLSIAIAHTEPATNVKIALERLAKRRRVMPC